MVKRAWKIPGTAPESFYMNESFGTVPRLPVPRLSLDYSACRFHTNGFMNGVEAPYMQFHEWNSVIFASAETHRNPRVHIISLLDFF